MIHRPYHALLAMALVLSGCDAFAPWHQPPMPPSMDDDAAPMDGSPDDAGTADASSGCGDAAMIQCYVTAGTGSVCTGATVSPTCASGSFSCPSGSVPIAGCACGGPAAPCDAGAADAVSGDP
jgi:hypothetical protein